MAGESPDRSKQRESSVEPTSGKAGPVPEARDPRLTVSRESDERGGVDTATKVLSTRDLTSGAKPPAPQDEARLRQAVAAWVRPGDQPSGQDAAEAKPSGREAAEAKPSRQGAAEAKPSRQGAAEAKPSRQEAAEAKPSRQQAAEAKPSRQEAAEAKPSRQQAAEAKPSRQQAAEAKPSRQQAAEAKPSRQEAAEAKTAPSKAPETEETGAEAPEEDNAGGKASESDTPGSEASRAKGAEPEADEAEAAGDEKAGDDGGEGAARAASDAETVSDAPEDAVADPDGPADAVPKADTDATPEPAAADGDSAPQGPPTPDDESRTGGAGGNTKADAEGEAEAKSTAKPVDQPTAVFKAPKPRVDQPTTMLKLGGQPKPPASDPERTSKFVALKPLDDPSTRKPTATPKPAAAPASAPAPAPAPAEATTPVPQIGPERTTQQPLPPKPPLDLLAELTNTPPPPETPVRTLVRRVKIWTPLVLLLAVVFAVVQALRPLPAPTLALTAEESYTFDGRTSLPWPGEGQGWMDVDGIGTMSGFGKQTPVAIGSVAKTMTAYIILKEHPLKVGAEGPAITVDATAEKEGGYDKTGESTLNSVKEGDKLSEKQALSAVMIPSANNIARLLARWDAGSEAAFVKKMNATAKKLGMTHTTYTDPSGLKETTVSTARDQVTLGNAVVKIPALTAITSAASWTDPSGHNWPNFNQLPYVMGAIGIKTGSTTAAGGNLLFAARKEVGGETVTVVGAILGQHKAPILDTVNAVSKTALVAAKDALTSAKILKKGDVVGYVDDGLGGHTPVVVTQDVTAVGWAGLKAKLSFAADDVPHTAKAGTKVGTLTVGDGKSGAVKVPVALQKDLTEPGLGSKLTRLG
ncbi:D-alanyl-D-alanine carboxypeptidase [Streptomyces sp. NPDC004542]|uniref:D-alanyl-D-alanine carboxypeptidase n=1 Tax=Streptomyces sp. NPDC004542 TaxID=3154281 RepID=UPI0033B9EAAD